MRIDSALTKAAQDLTNISSTPHLDAELLLARALNKPRSFLYAHPEHDFINNQFEKLLTRRLNGEPIAYILGHKEFWSLNLKINPEVLIPRPETELLIELVLKYVPQKKDIKLADLGTGSGAIALAVASERPDWEITATDINIKALKVAQDNAKNFNIKNIKFLQGDWCRFLAPNSFDVIISNPPYLPSSRGLTAGSRFEPPAALVSAENGLQDLRIIIEQAKNILKSGGLLMLEHGFDQAEIVQQFMRQQKYSEIMSYKDLAGHMRVTIAHYKPSP